MNERIRELVDQAFDTAEYPADQQYRVEPNTAFCEKFAEFIVKECARVVDNLTETDNPIEYRNSHETGTDVLQHFGVEL